MTFKDFLLTESTDRVLFHGTVLDNLRSIQENGLVAKVGGFVDTMYDDENIEKEPAVYLADKKGIHKAINAMRFHVGQKIGKWVGEVNAEDVRKHGLLVKVSMDSGIDQKPEDPNDERGEEYPHAAEPGDYFSFDDILPDSYFYGNKLIQFLKRYNLMAEFKETIRDKLDPLTRKNLQGKIVNLYLTHPKYKEEPKDKILSFVSKLSDPKLVDMVRKHIPGTNL